MGPPYHKQIPCPFGKPYFQRRQTLVSGSAFLLPPGEPVSPRQVYAIEGAPEIARVASRLSRSNGFGRRLWRDDVLHAAETSTRWAPVPVINGYNPRLPNTW